MEPAAVHGGNVKFWAGSKMGLYVELIAKSFRGMSFQNGASTWGFEIGAVREI